MEIDKLYQFVLIILLVGMLVGVGVLALDKFGTASRESTVVTNESFVVPAVNSVVTLSNGNMTTFTQVLNSTGDVWNSDNYTVTLLSGVLNNTGNQSCKAGDTCYAYYTYDKYNTVPITAINAGRDAVGEVSTQWLSLIITIGILAVIIGLVVSGFYLSTRK